MEAKRDEIAEGMVSSALFVLLLVLVGLSMGGCGFRYDIYYYGQTPMGFDNRQATELQQKQARPAPRVVKVDAD